MDASPYPSFGHQTFDSSENHQALKLSIDHKTLEHSINHLTLEHSIGHQVENLSLLVSSLFFLKGLDFGHFPRWDFKG
jgi:hypothetical protein